MTHLSSGSPGANAHRLAGVVLLFHAALARVVASPPDQSQAAVVGAALGILFVDGECDENQLLSVAIGYLSGTQEPRKSCGILRGLLATAREVAWQVSEFLQAVDAQFATWDEETFLSSLPELRLAFSDLTPRETSQVADQVAQLHGESTLGDLVQTDLDESDVQLALEITRRVRESLKEDGLDKGSGLQIVWESRKQSRKHFPTE